MEKSLEYIEKLVCDYRRIPMIAIHSCSRESKSKETRQIIMTLQQESGHSTHSVGDFFNRDHSTVSSAKKRINNLCESDKELKGEMDLFRIKLGLNNSLQNYINELLSYRTKIDNIINFLQSQII